MRLASESLDGSGCGLMTSFATNMVCSEAAFPSTVEVEFLRSPDALNSIVSVVWERRSIFLKLFSVDLPSISITGEVVRRLSMIRLAIKAAIVSVWLSWEAFSAAGKRPIMPTRANEMIPMARTTSMSEKACDLYCALRNREWLIQFVMVVTSSRTRPVNVANESCSS